MYNKLFSKITDSSIWTEDPETCKVWITLLAKMDQFGVAQLASIKNVSMASGVPLDKTMEAIEKFEQPDCESSDPEFEGRRIERTAGGWIILNAEKYKAIATLEEKRAKDRRSQQLFRERKQKKTVSKKKITVKNSNPNVISQSTNSNPIQRQRQKTDLKESKPKKKSAIAARRFTPPLPHEVNQYLEINETDLLGCEFCDFYQSKGWMVGTSKMKDWKAAARRWKRNQPQKGTEGNGTSKIREHNF